MSISPYTMDILYRNGSIDYVPYELMAPTQNANKPLSYQVQSPSVALNSLGMSNDYYEAHGVNEYRDITKDHKTPYTKKSILKGLASLGILIGTGVLLIKGKKAFNFDMSKIKAGLSKLNPLKWFKK